MFLLILADELIFFFFLPRWLFKPFKLLNGAINPGITTGKVNYGSCLETLQWECVSSVSGSHAVTVNTHVTFVYPHTVYTDIYKKPHLYKYTRNHTIHTWIPPRSPRTRKGQWTLCSVDFWLVPSEDLISWLFIYFYPGRPKVWLLLLLRLFS